jgi:hypothetical protein
MGSEQKPGTIQRAMISLGDDNGPTTNDLGLYVVRLDGRNTKKKKKSKKRTRAITTTLLDWQGYSVLYECLLSNCKAS